MTKRMRERERERDRDKERERKRERDKEREKERVREVFCYNQSTVRARAYIGNMRGSYKREIEGGS